MDNNPGKSGLSDRVSEGFKKGSRPGFLGGEGGGEAPGGSKAEKRANERASANGAAADSLRGAEDNAGKGLYNHGDGVEAAKKNEQDGGGFYAGGGGFANNVGAIKDFKKGNFKGAFKKAGPLLGIFLVIFGVGALFMGTQLFQPFSFIAQLQESFNSMHPSAYNRSARIFRYQMGNGLRKSPLKKTIFGTEKFSLSKKQIEQYEKQGLKYNDNYEGSGKRVLEYETAGGMKRVVAANKEDADFLKGLGHTNAISFDAVLNDTTFAHKFDVASITWRGQFANWFGTETGKFLKTNKLTRNLWKDWETMKKEAQANGKKPIDVIKETIGKRTGTVEDGGIRRTVEDGEDENGNKKYNTPDAEKSKLNRSNLNEETVRTKISNIGEKISGKTGGGAVSKVANVGCAVVDFIGAVNLLVTASEALQIINLTTSYMEAFDKTKAGYGDEAPINELADTLNSRVENTNVTLEPTGTGEGLQITGENGSTKTIDLKTAENKTSKTAMQSAGIEALYSNGLTKPNDPNVQTFNLNKSMNRILGGVGVTMQSLEGCMLARSAAAIVDAGKDIAEIISCAVSFWAAGGACWGLVVDAGISIAAGVGLSFLIQGIVSVITPWVTNALTRDLVSNLGGEELGNALVSGGNMYQGNVHKANGGSLSTRQKYTDFAVAKEQMLAEEAKLERENLSPFDITSKNTFMGAFMTQLMGFNSTNSLMSTLTSTNTVMTSSLLALTPSTSAVASQIAESLPTEEEYKETCPYLASIHAVGDSYCNPYMVTDMDTINEDPGDVILAVGDANLDNINGDGNVKIKKGSALAEYIEYCGERTSAFGVADQNIAEAIRGGTGNSIADSVIGSVPVLGDGVEVTQNAVMLNKIGYISGQSCVAGAAKSVGDSPDWNVAKYYQRFIEDQSLAESMGIIEKSAVAEYLEEYYEENPLDETYEGRLARWSGLDKETVTDVLDVIAYYNYIDAYDASERYAFGAPVVDESEKAILFDNEMTMDGTTVALEWVVYADVRNRNFVV